MCPLPKKPKPKKPTRKRVEPKEMTQEEIDAIDRKLKQWKKEQGL